MRFISLGAARLALFLPLAFLPAVAHATIYNVTSDADSGAGSLREVITLANADPDGGFINIAPSITNIQLASALPTITGSVGLQAYSFGGFGPDTQNTTIGQPQSPTAKYRFFTVAPGATLTLYNLRLDGGAYSANATASAGNGGLIYNRGTLYVSGCSLDSGKGAQGGNIYNEGNLGISGSHLATGFAVEGGNLYNAGNARISNSEVVLGSAVDGEGAGIYTSGSLLVQNSTIELNYGDHGAGLYIADNADLTTTSTQLENSTVANNTATVNGGGIWLKSGALSLDSVTIAQNMAPQDATAGLYAPDGTHSQITLGNTILGDNLITDGTSPNLDLFLGNPASVSLISSDYNIFGASSGTFTSAAHDQIGVTAAQLALSNINDSARPNGIVGGRTITPLSGSVAINKGGTALGGDQLGRSRPNGSQDDVGALETDIAPSVHSFTIDRRINEYMNIPLGGQDAEGNAITYTLVNGTLPDGLYFDKAKGTIVGAATQITKSTTVDFQASDHILTSEIFHVTFVLREAYSTVVNDASDSTPSAFDGLTTLREAVTLVNSALFGDITFNLPEGDRTIALNTPLPKITADLEINGPTTGGGVTIKRNSAKGTPRFRLIETSSKQFSVKNLTLSGGDAFTESGGAVLNIGGLFDLSNCTLTGNTAAQGGAVASLGAGSITGLVNCTLSGNTATKPATDTNGGGGGALYNGGQMGLEFCTVVGNYAPAGLSAGVSGSPESGAVLTIQDSIIAGNLVRGTTQPGIDIAVRGATGNAAAIVSKGYNLVGDGNAAVNFNAATDHTNVADADLHLIPLADNGGPTATIALRTGSPAYNAAAADQYVSLDQRGLPRQFGSAPDIGAYELQADTSPTITALPLTPAQPYTDDPLHATATVTTADNSVPTLTYAWTRTRDGVTDVLPEKTDTLQTAGSVVVVGDVITVTVTATSGLGESSKQAGVTILNSPIQLVGFKLQPRATYTNDTVIANIQTSDVDRTPALYTFVWTKNGVPTRTTANSRYPQDTYNLKTDGNGDHGDIIGVTVSATDGASTVSAQGSATILNTVPVISGLTLAPTAPTPLQTVTATYGGHDADPGDKIKPIYHWKIGKKDLPAEQGSRLDLSKYSFVKPGDVVTCAARVTDGTALSKTLTATVTVGAPATAPLTAPATAPVKPSGNAS